MSVLNVDEWDGRKVLRNLSLLKDADWQQLSADVALDYSVYCRFIVYPKRVSLAFYTTVNSANRPEYFK